MSIAPEVKGPNSVAFQSIASTFNQSGPGAALDRLVDDLTQRGEFRALLDALLLKARFDLNLPLVQVGPLNDLAEPVRGQYEERYVEAIRKVGGLLLDSGNIPAAWPYFRAIGEPESVRAALDTIVPPEGDEVVGHLIDIAFNQGAHPQKGFALILEHYGTCSAITSFEQLPPDEQVRGVCAELLTRQLYEHLTANVRAEIIHRGKPEPAESASLEELLKGNEWLFEDDSYHIDVSHLASTVRLAPLLRADEVLRMARGLCQYGQGLSIRHQYDGDPPFENTYLDHGAYLDVLLGQQVDQSLTHFRSKIEADQEGGFEQGSAFPAQVLVGLLVRLNRIEEAIDVASQYLVGLPESMLICPGVAQLCQLAGRPDRLLKVAEEQGDLVNYTAAMLLASGSGPTKTELSPQS